MPVPSSRKTRPWPTGSRGPHLLSRTFFELGEFTASARYHAELKTLDTALAEKYAYLAGDSGTRAAQRDQPAAWFEE